MADAPREFIPFRFRVALYDGAGGNLLCRGAFSEVSGLEATMAPKALKEGGRNWGEVQLSGPTTFAPVILKRGITELADLWQWFDMSTRQSNYALRVSGTIDVFHPEDPDKPLLRWRITNALPTKFKGPDLSSTASQVAIEELQLVHEGLELERGSSP
ncbi:phage tail protein [Aromatoleum evansii]|uniref:Phage tail protein n=1 Tax=Aromatoleum evansii TaxID=59406 RepID=A0ABZ1AKH8_AROEV|nr:phage tail protein [Aromatoleum evansii]NMG27645.1 phage tail protein [Aromatoleum evansii]WRL46368.1 phage tail protein [Aromatoleum evansii]